MTELGKHLVYPRHIWTSRLPRSVLLVVLLVLLVLSLMVLDDVIASYSLKQ